MLKTSIYALRRTTSLAARLLVLAFASLAVCSAQEQRKALDMPTPIYPEIAKHMNLTGTVKLKATITPDGRVKRTEVLGGHPLLADAAVDAVKRWKYAPGKDETEVELEFHFHP